MAFGFEEGGFHRGETAAARGFDLRKNRAEIIRVAGDQEDPVVDPRDVRDLAEQVDDAAHVAHRASGGVDRELDRGGDHAATSPSSS